MLVAAEDKKVSIYQVFEDPESTPTIIAEMVGHSNRCVRISCRRTSDQTPVRVKAVETLPIALPKTTSNGEDVRATTTIVCTISSDGMIFVYDLAALPTETSEKLQLHPVAEYDTKGTRLTCLTVAEGRSAAGSMVVNGKRKEREEDVDNEEEAEWDPQFEAGENVGVNLEVGGSEEEA